MEQVTAAVLELRQLQTVGSSNPETTGSSNTETIGSSNPETTGLTNPETTGFINQESIRRGKPESISRINPEPTNLSKPKSIIRRKTEIKTEFHRNNEYSFTEEESSEQRLTLYEPHNPGNSRRSGYDRFEEQQLASSKRREDSEMSGFNQHFMENRERLNYCPIESLEEVRPTSFDRKPYYPFQPPDQVNINLLNLVIANRLLTAQNLSWQQQNMQFQNTQRVPYWGGYSNVGVTEQHPHFNDQFNCQFQRRTAERPTNSQSEYVPTVAAPTIPSKRAATDAENFPALKSPKHDSRG